MIWVLVGSYPKGMLHDLLVMLPAVSDMAHWMGTCTAIALNFGNQSIFCSFHVNVGLVSESGFTCLFTLVDCTGSHFGPVFLTCLSGMFPSLSVRHVPSRFSLLIHPGTVSAEYSISQDSHITPWLRVQTGTP